MKLSRLEVLSESEIPQIHQSTLEILERVGVKIGCPRMLGFLKEKGLRVVDDVVHFTPACLEDALSRIPATFEVFSREGQSAFVLGDGVPKIAAGHNAVFWVDSHSGQTRPSRVSDVECFARICDQLDGIHMIGIPVMPQDVPNPQASLLYGVKACIENSIKPIYFSTDNRPINHAIIEMLRVAFKGNLKDQVYGISQLSPTSPLMWEKGVLEAIQDMVDTGVPIAVLPEPNAGISAPYTLAGLLTMNNAECLSGLAMIQMLRPGTKVMYANSWTTTDMRTGSALVGSTETTICRIAAAQLARFYKTPSHTTAPNSDNHAHDEQNAWEKTFSTFCSVAAGHDLVVNCGMFATGMTCSHEQLLMDEEISTMSNRIAEGLLVNNDTVALDVIEKLKHRPMYMTAEHTMEWLRSKEYLFPRLAVRGPRAAWEEEGAKDTYQRARDLAKGMFMSSAASIDVVRSQKLGDIIHQFRSL